MPYSQHTRRNTPAIAAVVGVHLVIGYAFVSGLAYKVIEVAPTITSAYNVPDAVTPPPQRQDLPPPRATDRSTPTTVVPEVTVPLTSNISTIETVSRPDFPIVADTGPVIVPPQPLPPVRPSQSRMAEPAGGRAGWVTTDDYPPQALREGVSGTVGISVMVGADGRVTSCEVTGSSGNRLLDEATCRFYARRARFRAALDSDGKAIPVRYMDRVRWQLPE